MGLGALTSPVQDITLAIIFFIILLVFLISTGYWLFGLSGKSLGQNHRFLVVITSIFIVILLMFRSAQSLNLTDFLILILTAAGVIFYMDRRRR